MNVKSLQGQKIKAIRLQKGLSQETVAYDLKITQPTLARIENGKSDVSLSRLWQLATYFKMSTRELIVDQLDTKMSIENQKIIGVRQLNETKELHRRVQQLESQISDKEKIIQLLENEIALLKV